MYQPAHFSSPDATLAHAVMHEQPFATLVSVHDNAPFITHCPLVTSVDSRVLHGHMARANPHHNLWQPEQSVLAIFHGPDAYVSPNWYAPEHAVKAVPTWNYVVVHARGTLTIVDDEDGKDALLKRLIERMEPAYADQWRALPREYQSAMLRGIVGFEIAVTQIDAKFKLSQNGPAANRPLVAARLQAGGMAHSAADAASQAVGVADWMKRLGVV
jgi:transcriptional regulator